MSICKDLECCCSNACARSKASSAHATQGLDDCVSHLKEMSRICKRLEMYGLGQLRGAERGGTLVNCTQHESFGRCQ